MKKITFLFLIFVGVLQAQIVSIPDANFKVKLLEASPSNTIAQNISNQNIKIDVNDDGEIQESEALLVRSLDVSNSNISSLEGISSFFNIRELRANDNSLTSLYLNGMDFLNVLDISNNQIVSQSDLYITSNYYDSLSLNFSNNLLTSYNLNLFLIENSLSELSIMFLNLNNNPFDIVDLSSDSEISSIYVELKNTTINSLTGNLKDVNGLYIENNPFLQTINLNLNSNNNFIELLSIHNNQSLEEVTLYSDFFIQNGNTMDISINDNVLLNDLNIINISSSGSLGIRNCPLNNLNIQNSKFFVDISIVQVQTESIDLSSLQVINYNIDNCPLLRYLNIKNGINQGSLNYLNMLPELEYICADEEEVESVQININNSFPNVQVNSYCSFVPGGEFYTIQGNTKLDLENNVCDESDMDFPNMKFNITNGSISGTIISNTSGNYSIPVQAGTHTITPVFENSTYFNVNPPNFAVAFPALSSPFTQNLCVTANGVHPDLEVVIAPITPARPGFVAEYVIVYKNKGNQVLSQQNGVNFVYNQNLMQFLSASAPPSAQSAGGLQWDYADLMPFESRSIVVSMQINPPTHPTHPVNIDDVLVFTSIILPQSGDEMVQDNTFVFNQTVVGSYDPNDITCLQGDVVSPSEIGNYLHYLIRFENTGNAPAENVVVKVEIDSNQFDTNSLQMLSSSYDTYVCINGNKIEFIFQNIQLESGGHGNILLKMKTKSSLQVGDMVAKKANIYFDYNFPIITNQAETLFQALSVVNPVLDNLITIYPNPVKDIVNITIKDNSILKTIELYDVKGRLLQTQLVNDVHSELNVSSRAKGMYFIKINTDKGSKVEKLIKE